MKKITSIKMLLIVVIIVCSILMTGCNSSPEVVEMVWSAVETATYYQDEVGNTVGFINWENRIFIADSTPLRIVSVKQYNPIQARQLKNTFVNSGWRNVGWSGVPTIIKLMAEERFFGTARLASRMGAAANGLVLPIVLEKQARDLLLYGPYPNIPVIQ